MYIDLICILFALYGFWMGYRKGLIRTLFSLLSFIIGLLLTLKFSPYVVEFISNTFHVEKILALVIGLLVCFFVVMGIVKWIGKSIEKMLTRAKLNTFNKIQGGIILSFLMIVMYSVIIWFLDRTQLISDHQRVVSKAYPFLIELPAKMQAFLLEFKPLFEKFWQLVQDVISTRSE
jgi:membrane protein required for colicin V production